jgi:hypothetical protein
MEILVFLVVALYAAAGLLTAKSYNLVFGPPTGNWEFPNAIHFVRFAFWPPLFVILMANGTKER